MNDQSGTASPGTGPRPLPTGQQAKAETIAAMYRNWLEYRKRAIGQELSEVNRQLDQLDTLMPSNNEP